MKLISVIEDEKVIYRILAHLKLLSPGDGPRAPPKSAGFREVIYEPVFDLPVRRTCLRRERDQQAQTGDLSKMELA